MKTNMGLLDRGIRLLVVIAIIVLYLTEVISGVLAITLGIIAVVFLATSLFGICPLYLPFKISTKKRKKEKE